MRNVLLLTLMTAAGTAGPVLGQPLSNELQKLNISAGHWVYHGETLNTPFGKAGKWTWNEDCGWSENQVFMVCSFTNNRGGKIVKSLVADTYNEKDKSYWHYELFDSDSGDKPFISKMSVNGNTRIEYASGGDRGKQYQTRIIYVFDSPTQVKVKIEISHHGSHWVLVDQGEGIKQP